MFNKIEFLFGPILIATIVGFIYFQNQLEKRRSIGHILVQNCYSKKDISLIIKYIKMFNLDINALYPNIPNIFFEPFMTYVYYVENNTYLNNNKCLNEETLLHIACRTKNLKLVNILLGYKDIDVFIKNNHDETALDIVRKNKFKEILNILKKFIIQKLEFIPLNNDILYLIVDYL